MTKFLKLILIFVIFFCSAYIPLLIIWANIPYLSNGSNFYYRQGDYGHLFSRTKDIRNYKNVDILFVGSSRVYRGVDPRIFKKAGLNVFVLGSSSQTPLQTYVLLSRYMIELKPKLVVFDVLPSSFSNEGVEPALDVIANDKLDILSWEMAINLKHITVWNSLLFAELHSILGFKDKFIEPKYKSIDQDLYISGGYVEKALVFNNKFSDKSKRWKRPLKMQLSYFKRCLKLCRKMGSEISVVNFPNAEHKNYTNNQIILDSFKNSHQCIDINDALFFNCKTDFYDNLHLNSNGVKKMNLWFIRNMKSNK